MSNEKPVENPNLGRKKTYNVDVVVITIIAIKREKQCRISVSLLCDGLSGMYLCIIRGPHFAHCLSHEIKQFLSLKNIKVIALKAPYLQPRLTFLNHKNTHTLSTLLISLRGSRLEWGISYRLKCNEIVEAGFEYWL